MHSFLIKSFGTFCNILNAGVLKGSLKKPDTQTHPLTKRHVHSTARVCSHTSCSVFISPQGTFLFLLSLELKTPVDLEFHEVHMSTYTKVPEISNSTWVKVMIMYPKSVV